MLLSLARFVSASDLREYGATCDGRDDTAAFQAAVAEARVKPQPIELPAGVCGLRADALVIDAPGITIRGQGIGATAIRLLTNGDGIRFGATPPVASFVSCGGLEHLTISGGPERTAGRAIVVTRCTRGHIDDVQIEGPGHGLAFVCPTGDPAQACARWFVDRLFIDNQGPTAAVWIEGGNDRFFRSIHIAGRRDPGSRGFLFLESGGDWITDADVLMQEVGVSIEPPAGKRVEFLHLTNVMADTSSVYGYRIGGQGTVRGLSFVSPWAGGTGVPTPVWPDLPPGAGAASRGFRVVNGDGLVFLAPRVWANGGTGFEVAGSATNVEVLGGWAGNNSQAAPGLMPGFLFNASGLQADNLRSGDVALPGFLQSCGVELGPAALNVQVSGGDYSGNAVGGICSSTAE